MTQFEADKANLERRLQDGPLPTEQEIRALIALRNDLKAQQDINELLARLAAAHAALQT